MKFNHLSRKMTYFQVTYGVSSETLHKFQQYAGELTLGGIHKV